MTDLWYPITDHHPAPIVQVRAFVEVEHVAAEVIASRGRAPHVDEWVEWRQRVPVRLPRGAVKAWAPQKPESWKAPLPMPLRVSRSDGMWSSTTDLTIVGDAAAAELADEMEHDRADARRGSVADAYAKEGLPWWRDADQVKYEPVGKITPRMAEGRVMRAVATCGHNHGLTLRYRSFGTLLADISARTSQVEYATSDYAPRLKPLPRDVADFETAMSWFVALNPAPLPAPSSRAAWEPNEVQDLLLMRARAIPISFATIAGERRTSWQAVQGLYDRAIKRVCRIANGELAPTVDHIEALKDRNREWKTQDRQPVDIQNRALEALRRA